MTEGGKLDWKIKKLKYICYLDLSKPITLFLDSRSDWKMHAVVKLGFWLKNKSI